jgi:hypothetical protein
LPSCVQEVEAGDLTGVLDAANNDRVIISNAQETKDFVTNDLTEYNTNGESNFCTNDIVTVKYHSKGGKLVIDNMTLKKHVHKDLTFSGTITDTGDKTVTIFNKSLTVTFSYDDTTVIDGKLTKGSEVKLIYVGDLSEFPKATKITVTKQEKEEPKTLTVNGVISDFTDTSMLLGIDSAHSMKFTINKDTKITGIAKKIQKGDSVTVTYNNTKDAEPLATEINITKEPIPEVQTLNGTIKSVGSSAISVDTSNKTYTFTINDKTKYKGVKPAVGCETEITYSVVEGKNIAYVIYCQKAPTPPEKPIKAKGTIVSWGNGNTTISLDGSGNINLTYSNKTEMASDYKPQANDYVQIEYMKSTKAISKINLIKRPDPPKPVPPKPIEANGIVKNWAPKKCTITVNGTDLNLTYSNDLIISPGYNPMTNDEVKITYTDKDKVLSKIELVKRPVPPAPVKAEGTLTAWGIDGQDKCTIQTATENLTLTYTANSLDISVGYMPQADDNIKFEYMKETNELKKIELINRPDYSVSAEGTLVEWAVDGENKCTIDIQGSGETTLNFEPGKLDIPIGYMPQAKDYVSIVYTTNDNALKQIKLINRPQDEKKSEEPEVKPDEPEVKPEEPEVKPEEPEVKPEEPEVKPEEPETKPEEPEVKNEEPPKDTSEDNKGSKDSPLIKVERITIVSFDKDKQSFKMKAGDKDAQDFKIDENTSVASGYIPQDGDIVSIVYSKDDMTLKEIKLVERPVDKTE